MEEKNKIQTQKGSAAALLPIGVFLVFFLGAGFISGDFYSMPAILAFLIALFVAFLQDRKHTFNEKIHMIAKGVGDDNIITMCLIFLAAGAFSGAVTAAGGADSTVNLGLSILPSGVAVVGLFIIGCFISVSMGTSMGTIAALAPIAVGIAQKTGYSMALCVGAVMCGAMFGDNLSMISDTTIAAVKTQGCEMKDKFRENFLIVDVYKRQDQHCEEKRLYCAGSRAGVKRREPGGDPRLHGRSERTAGVQTAAGISQRRQYF